MGDRILTTSRKSLEDMRLQFRRQQYIRLPGFFERGLIEMIAAQAAAADWDIQRVSGISSKWVMKPNALVATLSWYLNDLELIQRIGDITGCEDIGSFTGRVYRIDPDSGQAFDWHDDREFEKGRRLAISVNLGMKPYSGGVLRLRAKQAREDVSDIPNPAPGDAAIFRVADELEHCVTPVEGSVPKLAFSGWFKTGQSYYSSLLRQGQGARRQATVG